MSHLRLKRFASSTLASALLLGTASFPALLVSTASAQTATTGALSGVVSDPSGAVIPNAVVTLTSKASGTKTTVKSDGSGRYSFTLLPPAAYTLSTVASGMSTTEESVNILLGQNNTANVTLSASGGSQNVTVSAQAVQLTDTQSPSLITTFNTEQVQNLPAPGGDITTVAYTVPGVVVNAGGAYGNFSVDGLPGTSNLYVINGFDDEDPFLNLNNSGSSNLTLGQGEIAEAAVVVNGYSSQYGRAAGAIIDYTTKAGTNAFHGQANYYYNGDTLNANDWFKNYVGQARQKAVSNEWAANVGGPIIKNKLFFFADYEGLHYVLPATGIAIFPTQQFQNYALANVQPSSVPFYQQAFGLYNASPNAKSATPVTAGSGPFQDSSGAGGCADFAGTQYGPGQYFGALPAGVTTGTTVPCENVTIGSASNTNKEYLVTARVDWNISDRQKLFGRFKLDHGTQPTSTSFISPVFNVISSQPAYEGQLNDTIQITPNVTNQFVFAANWYTAYFGPSNLAATLAAFPTYFDFAVGGVNLGGTFGDLGAPYYFPQGRNVSQYQFVDDLAWVKGNHTFRFGYDFRRDDVSDYDAQVLENGLYFFGALGDLANGAFNSGGSEYLQNFATQKTAYLALYNIGAYAQDDWQANSRLHLTLGVRFDRNGNPLCNNNCFARYDGTFPQGNTSTDIPYNQAVTANYQHAFNNIEDVIAQGRFGFNYSLTSDGHTVIRGGVGLFADVPPATFLDQFVQNFPNLYSATVVSGNVGPAGNSGTVGYNAAQSNTAVESGYGAGQSETQISAALKTLGVPFSPPNLALAPLSYRTPKYLEFNLQLQKQFTASDAIIIGYTGNTGYDELIQNPYANAFNAGGAPGFGALATAAPDPRFTAVNSYENEANSNYNAVAVTYKHHDRRGLTVDLTYAYSHALDDISNGGNGEYYNSSSVVQQLSPVGVAALNYSNADYDIRNNVTTDYSYQMPFIKRYGKVVNSVAGGWLFAGKTFWRTGEPFSIVNSGVAAAVSAGTIATPSGAASPEVLAEALPGQTFKTHCNGNGLSTPCFSASQFFSAPSSTVATSDWQQNFGTFRRNAFFGPHYADSDFALSKKFFDSERASVALGAYAFNVFNHPNFSNPSSDVNAGGVGESSSILAPPTSPYGSFQSAGVGGRVLQVFGKVTF